MGVLAEPTVQIDNELMRVTQWRFAPGAATGHHRHEYDYAVVPLSTGTLKIIDANGDETHVQLTVGQSYFRRAGVEHNVINANDYEFVFVDIERKP